MISLAALLVGVILATVGIGIGTKSLPINASQADIDANDKRKILGGIMIILGILISSGVVVVKIFSSRSEEDIRRMSSVFEPRRSSISSRRSSGNSYQSQQFD